MKKLFSILSIAAISFAAITSCAKEEQASVAEEGINITVIAGDKDVDNDPSKTKTYVSEDGNTVHVYWQDVETEKLMVYELIDNGNTAIRYNESSKADIKDGGVTAEFQTSIYGETPTGEHTYKYTAIYPSSASKPEGGKYRVEIPQIQNLNGTNLAPNADVLVGIPYDNGNTRITDGAKIDYQFKRFGTTVKMTLKGINEGETVSKVEITAPKGISGFGVVDLTSGEITETTGHKTTMTLNLNQVVDETTNISVWFRVLSGTWTVSNDKPLKVVVTTDEATYTKEITAIASLQNKLEFAEGGLTAFGISGMTRDENSVIEDGDYVITAVNESTKYIMLAYESGNNIKSETYTLNDEGNFVFNSSSTHDPEECVYTFTRVTEEGDFKGCYTIKDCKGNYLYAAGKNTDNHLKADNPDNKDASFYWTITCVEGVYSIVAKSTNRNNLKFNSSNNPPIFSCYASGQKAVTLYPASKLVIDRTPRIEVSANELNYAADGTTKDSPITVNAKYCDATAEATTGSDWISGVSISEGVLVLTVSANTDAEERQGTITISSITSGVESKSISITQAAHSDQPQGGEGTINFGNGEGDCAINSASVNGTDTNGQEWTITTSGTSYYGQNTNYSQIGSSGDPADGITFTTTLPNDAQITNFSAKFGGFSGTAGTVKLKVGETEVGSGSLNAGTDVTVNINENKKGTVGKVLTVTITNISKGVKAYYISYAYKPNKTVENIAVKTSPTTTTYYVGDTFDPAGLVITATYDDASTEDIAYVGNESKFTFSPALNAALQTSDESVSITYGGKTTTQGVSVNARPVFTVIPSNNSANPIAVGEGEYDEEPISVTAGEDVVWTVTKVSGADDIEFTQGSTGSGNINVKIGANTGASRDFVLRVSSNTAGVSPASYDVYLSQEASSAIITVALATPTGLAYDNTGKKLTWNAVATDVNGKKLVDYTPKYNLSINGVQVATNLATTQFDITTISPKLPEGGHTATLVAVGDGTVYTDSEAATLASENFSVSYAKVYKKVTSLTAGKTYLIVGGKTTAKVMAHPTSSNATISAIDATTKTSGDDTIIEGTTTIDACAVTISANGSSYSTITWADGNNTNYVAAAGSNTNLKYVTTAPSSSSTNNANWQISTVTSNGTFRIKNSSQTTRAIIWRAGSTNKFGDYATSNVNGTEYFDLDLYELQ